MSRYDFMWSDTEVTVMSENSNYVDPETGTITYRGSSEITKGDHSFMPHRTDAYLETDERGHVQASSLGGSNQPDNIVPQAADLNHGGYYQMEMGERSVLKDGGQIESEKIAYTDTRPGNRPAAFMVNDTVTYADGQTQEVHLSFSNLTNAEQESMNAESSAAASSLYDAYPNPGDELRGSMTPDEYSVLMEETDASLPGVRDMYEEGATAETVAAQTDMVWDFDADTYLDSADFGGGDGGPGISSEDGAGVSADDGDSGIGASTDED